jgi:hypothetical protein
VLRLRLVLLEAVPIPVAIAVDPLQAVQHDVLMVREEQVVAQPLPGLVQGDDVEDGRVGRAIIGRVRDAPEMSQLAAAKFVRHLAWLGIAVGIYLGGLQVGQALEGSAGEIGEHDDVLQAGDQAVPTEDGHKPGNSGRGEQVLWMVLVARQTQGCHVFHGLPVQSVELLVGRCDLRGYLFPVRQVVSGFQRLVGRHARLGRRPRLLVGHEVIFTAGVPGALRGQIDCKTDAAIGIDRPRAGALQPHDEIPAKVPAAIARGQLLAVARPLTFDMPPAREVLGFHFKDAGEIAAN